MGRMWLLQVLRATTDRRLRGAAEHTRVRARVLGRAWQVQRLRRVGRLRAGLLAMTLLATGGAAYTVKSGDTLSHLAQRFGVSVPELADRNGIDDPDHIVIGQVLQIPGRSGNAAGASGKQQSSKKASEATTHIVGRGESLGTIAKRYGLSTRALAAANGITNVNSIMAGTLLRVADRPPPPPGTGGGGGKTYTVQRGDTLSSIAQKAGTSTSKLVKANGLDDANRIYAGQKVKIPGSSGSGWSCVVPAASFINDFGVSKPDGRYHEGVDLFAPRGTMIHAPVGGTIKHIRGDRAGLQFTLHGDDGYTYIGAHLDAYGPSGRVGKGDRIGTVGNTGNARGGPTHLHFEMHHGSVVNPYATLKQYC